jgi:ADP-ribosylglycohydrolase
MLDRYSLGYSIWTVQSSAKLRENNGMTTSQKMVEHYRGRFTGCLLGGAVGDALGAPIEFMSYHQISERFGSEGIRDFIPAYGRIGAVTDDTQMTLFTAEGLVRAQMRWLDRGLCNVASVIHRAYLRWLATQGEKVPEPYGLENIEGWLFRVSELHDRRAPGNTCLSALRSSQYGTPDSPLNNSKGCGGVMRVAPIGLLLSKELDRTFEIGCEAAAITHGHPSGYLSAGFLAVLIGQLIEGSSLELGVKVSRQHLEARAGSKEILDAIDHAVTKAAEGRSSTAIQELGQGWVAEEALAIALYCCMVGRNFEDAVVLAVNHSGDSDSTGAITGNILGAAFGTRVIPSRWLEKVELRKTMERLALDMATLVTIEDPESLLLALHEDYPPN